MRNLLAACMVLYIRYAALCSVLEWSLASLQSVQYSKQLYTLKRVYSLERAVEIQLYAIAPKFKSNQ